MTTKQLLHNQELEAFHDLSIEASWYVALKQEFESKYMQQLSDFLVAERSAGQIVYPPREDIFRAFNSTPLSNVRLVIIGQDPYHGEDQAHGLSFSVPMGMVVPPSLRNIYKELVSDCGIDVPQHGYLQSWADQGVLLLNSVLTVKMGLAASHRDQGWERFTDAVVELLNQQCESLVFMLWGNYAQSKGAKVDRQRHLVLEAPHPSPLSAHRGFIGCAHFSRANRYLQERGLTNINWQI